MAGEVALDLLQIPGTQSCVSSELRKVRERPRGRGGRRAEGVGTTLGLQLATVPSWARSPQDCMGVPRGPTVPGTFSLFLFSAVAYSPRWRATHTESRLTASPNPQGWDRVTSR